MAFSCARFSLIMTLLFIEQKTSKEELDKIVSTYFRPKRVTELIQQSQKKVNSSDRDTVNSKNKAVSTNLTTNNSQSITSLNRINSGLISGHSTAAANLGMNKTWAGDPSFQSMVKRKIIDDGKSCRFVILCSLLYRPTTCRLAAQL